MNHAVSSLLWVQDSLVYSYIYEHYFKPKNEKLSAWLSNADFFNDKGNYATATADMDNSEEKVEIEIEPEIDSIMAEPNIAFISSEATTDSIDKEFDVDAIKCEPVLDPIKIETTIENVKTHMLLNHSEMNMILNNMKLMQVGMILHQLKKIKGFLTKPLMLIILKITQNQILTITNIFSVLNVIKGFLDLQI